MDNRYRFGKPKEGLNTLVARFSFAHFDKAVEKIKALRRQGASEDQILEHIKEALRHADEITRKNIHQLALGLTPRDDISAQEVAGQVEVKEGTQQVELTQPREDVEAAHWFLAPRARLVHRLEHVWPRIPPKDPPALLNYSSAWLPVGLQYCGIEIRPPSGGPAT